MVTLLEHQKVIELRPEGYVAVDKVAGAVKLVDRLEFSRQNFTMPKRMELMRTIPDTIDLIKNKLIRILDCYYSIIESLGVKFTNYVGIKDGAIERKAQVIKSEKF